MNLVIKRGEIFGLLGPNDVGKITLIKILSTLLLLTSGKAYVEGFNAIKEPQKSEKLLMWSLEEKELGS